MLQRAVERARWDVNTRLARDRHRTRRMELAMTSLHPNLKPAILLKHRDELANLHTVILLPGAPKPHNDPLSGVGEERNGLARRRLARAAEIGDMAATGAAHRDRECPRRDEGHEYRR